MSSFQIQTLLFILVATFAILDRAFVNADFVKDFLVTRGKHHIGTSGGNLRLVLDESGDYEIRSKLTFSFGSVEMLIKLVPGNSAGTATAYYLSNMQNAEIGFYFFGNSSGEPYTIQTNIYVQGQPNRRQQFKPWFNPTSGFHNYTIHWNPSAVVWFVDGTPIRMFRNYETEEGVPFPNSQGMKVFTRLWSADGTTDGVTQGGRVQTNWTEAPFVAEGRRDKARACVWQGPVSINQCADPTIGSNWWTRTSFKDLTNLQLTRMKKVRDGFMIYDYCKDVNRLNGVLPKECSLKQN